MAIVVGLVAGLSGAAVGLAASPAAAAQETLVAETFTGTTTTSPHWSLPSAPTGTNEACLTAGTVSTPIPKCTSHTDSAGSGALRLTTNGGDEEGGVSYDLSVPSFHGIDASFDAYQYNDGGESAADGIGFFLAATNPADPAAPASIGQPGGALGYSAIGSSDEAGMSNAYMGIGLDVFGNYENTTYEGTGCTDPGWDANEAFPENVSVRGPGNGTVGYCMLNSTASNAGNTLTSGTLDNPPATSRTGNSVPVEVVINPSGSSITTGSGLSVAADSYKVAFTPLSGSEQYLSGTLPVATGLGFPSGWVNPSTGIPYQLVFGWVGSTGGSIEYHDVNNVTLETASGNVPTLSTSVTDNASGAPVLDSTMDYGVTVSDEAGTANDPGPIDVSDTIPSGETPQSSGLGGTGWSCTITGQQVTCSNSSALDTGDSLPTLTIPVTVTASPPTELTNTASASSDDSDPASGSDTVTVAKAASTIGGGVDDAHTGSSWAGTETTGATAYDTATITPGADPTPTGTFTYDLYDGGSCAGSPVQTSTETISGGAVPHSATTAALDPGTYSYQGTYSGDSNYTSETGSCESFTVVTGTGTTANAVDDAGTHAAWSGTETLGATAYDTSTVTGAGGIEPTGSVTYDLYDGGSCAGSPVQTSTETISGGTVPNSATTAALAAGTYSYHAVYSGDDNYNGDTSGCASFNVGKGSLGSATSVVDDASTSSAWAGSETTGATAYDTDTISGVGGFTPTGTVTYDLYDGGSCAGSPAQTSTETISGGVAPHSSTTATLAAGTYSYQAGYSGDSNYTSHTGSCVSFTVNKASASIGNTVDDAGTHAPWTGTETTGAQAYDTATVTGVEGFTPTGTVTYDLYDGGSCAGSPAQTSTETISGGTVPNSATSAALGTGTYSYETAYSGDSNYGSGGGGCESFSVTKAGASVGEQVDDAGTSSAWSGTEVTGAQAFDTATVSGIEGFTPTGTVTYDLYDGGSCAGSPAQTSTETISGGTAPNSATTAALAAGTYSYQATYSGDSSYDGSSSSCDTFTVGTATSAVGTAVDDAGTSSAWSGTEVTGAQAYDTATVTGIEGFTPTGSVTYDLYDGDSCIGDPVSANTQDLADGDVPNSSTTAALAAGTYSYQATYSGDSNYDGSSSTCDTFTVGTATSAVGTAVDDAGTSSAWSGTEVTGAQAYDTATVTGIEGFTPTGSVTYDLYDGDSCIGDPVSANTQDLAGGNVPNSSTTAVLAAGTYSYQATYSGDSNYDGSSSTCDTFTVGTATPAVGTAVDDAGTSSAWSGTEVTGAQAYDTATVAGVEGITPTGSVTYDLYDGGSCAGDPVSANTQDLAGGNVPNSSTTAALAAGTYSYQATYSGDSNYQESTGRCDSFAVASASTNSTIHSAPDPSVIGQGVTLSTSVAITAPGLDSPDAPTGTVEFEMSTDGGSAWTPVTACTAVTMTWSEVSHTGSAKCDTTPPATASETEYRAVYSGDANFEASTSSPAVVQHVGQATVATTLTSPSTEPSKPSVAVTFVDTLVVQAPGAGSPTGTVTFSEGSLTLCHAVALRSLTATCTAHLPVQPVAPTITAVYSGDSNFATSTATLPWAVLHGYWLVAADGGVFAYGDAQFYGTMNGHRLNAPMVGIAGTGDDLGYWTVAADGGVFSFGDAHFYGSTGSMVLNKPIIAMTPTLDGKGYYLVASDGGVFAFGDAHFYGSTGSLSLAAPIVGMVLSPDGRGYYLVGSDGGVFAYGDAVFHGSGVGSVPANVTVTGLATTADLGGYWLATSTGQVLAFGDATPKGSITNPSKPIVGMEGTADGGGYWLVASDGGVFALGDAVFDGSAGALPLYAPMVGMAAL
ncbi:MAG: beta strand repeat-containing protein [Acidimicrobiales bacterium]